MTTILQSKDYSGKAVLYMAMELSNAKWKLVAHSILIFGYSRLSLVRALSIVKCHETPRWVVLRWFCQAFALLLRVSISEIRRPRHCLVNTLNSISAISNQLPCFEV
uniref:Uncharacterized protein n=1 Tax=Candidatus Kentrum sp. LPFa TaxID=2126335 RepID=A0A450X1F4_9GAMM|nr:MAG: hypothetical protein BECKLPF1236B_GA0070989_13381 [Candidatus Kentron sp. LPFa]